MDLVTVLIPAYNEADNIEKTIKALQDTVPLPRQIIVVDDGSTDATFEIARSLKVEVYRFEKNIGKGGALNRILPMIKGSIILLVDADLGNSAREVSRLLEPVMRGDTDVAIAKFQNSKIKGFGLVKMLAKIGVYFYSGKTLESVLSGQRAMTRKVFERITPFTDGYSIEVASTIRMVNWGFKVTEIPVTMTHRITGRNIKGFYHRGKQFWHIFKFLVQKGFT
ncbi:MAG: glycosyltransferase family 2 protein [Zhaonellaceae bacterium]|jgi:glycosyltransferase involved in cell wall biosynthesis|nr:glycosyltransferase family 2 protein [Clostridia bacterium]